MSTGLPEDDPLSEGATWEADRRVRGFLIMHLLLRGPAPHIGHAAAVRLKGAFVTGAVDLSGADTTPLLELVDCGLEMPLRLTGAQAGSVHLLHCRIPRVEAEGFASRGSLLIERCLLPEGIALQQAQIGMDLTMSHSTVRGRLPGPAVDADGLTVAQDLIADGLIAVGGISLRGARIGGDLTLRGGVLRNPGGTALNAPHITVAHQMVLAPADDQENLHPHQPGTVRRSVLEGRVCLDGGVFGTALVIDKTDVALGGEETLSLRRIQTPEFVFTPVLALEDRGYAGWMPRVDVSHAAVGIMRDHHRSWVGGLTMIGLRYESLMSEGPFPLAERLAWVASATPEYSPEPYDQLASTLRARGEDTDADDVMLAKLRRRRYDSPLVVRLWEYVQDLTFGYGYRPSRALVVLLVLWSSGATWFAYHPPSPLKAGEGPHWNPVVYTVDLLLPVVDLGQASAWSPQGYSLVLSWMLVMAGWILATIVTAGAAKVVLRKD